MAMRSLARTLALSVTAVFVSAVLTLAQVVHTSKGAVEFFGLEKWTPEEIQEKLGYKSPDQMHYCAADLQKLGFADASVVGSSENGRRLTFVTVVEPQRGAEVVYLPRPTGHIPRPQTWDALRKALQAPEFLGGGVLDYARSLDGADAAQPWIGEGTEQLWWKNARVLNTDADFRQALDALSRDSDSTIRSAAAVVLMNFANHDEAWRSLVRGLRDPDGRVNATCIQALNSLATYMPRMVDWLPVSADIAHVLRGTNLFALRFLLKQLTATKIDPALSSPLLANGGGRLVLSYLRAQEDHDARDLAHRFLVQLRGRDLGTAPGPWEAWIGGLVNAAK